MKKPFFARHALLVLMVVFFFVPFAMRGARYAVQRMKNDVKDWLPDDFEETKELDWFRERFLGEQFVVISWEGCHGTLDDESFKTFVDKLLPELAPSEQADGGRIPLRADFIDPALGMYARQFMPTDHKEYDDFIGNRLDIHTNGQYYENWGGQREKWLQAGKSGWVYITPDGELYQWKANQTWPAGLWRLAKRWATGQNKLQGEYIASLGSEDGPWYYADPRRLTARLFKSITTGPALLSQMTSEAGRLKIDKQEALRRLNGILFGPDNQQTCLVVTLTEAGKRDPRAVVGRGMLGKPRGKLLDIAEESGIKPPPSPTLIPPALAWAFPKPVPLQPPVLKLGGPTVDNAAIDEEGQITLVRLVGFSVLLGLGLSWLCFRSFNITIMVFLVGGISAVASLSFIYWTGSSVDAVMMSMPSLVYVLGLSGAVHIVNYYRESVRDHGMRSAPGNAIKLGWRPCTLAAVTTALGLLSLLASNILPIRKFGIYSALGVVATLALLFTYLPAALQTWPPRLYLKRKPTAEGAEKHGFERFAETFWQRVGQFVIRRYRLVAVSCMLVLVVVGSGLRRIDTSIELLKMFDGDAKIIQDYRWLEANLGKLVPMEVVIRVDPSIFRNQTEPEDGSEPSGSGSPADYVQLSFLERMEIAEYARREIEHVFGDEGQKKCGRAMLASTFAPLLPPPTGGTVRASVRGGISRQLLESRDELLGTDYLRIDPDDGSELWRISLRLAALSDIDFGEFIHQIKKVVEPMLSAYQCRENVLTQLAVRSPDGSLRGLDVYMAGLSLEESRSPSEVQGDSPEIDQTLIFARTLQRVLKSAGLRVLKLPDDLDSLSAQACIVEISNDPKHSHRDLTATAALLVDARDHGFDPATEVTAYRDRTQDENVSAVYTGLVPVVYKAQRTLLDSLIKSTMWAFGMISVVMMLLLRSPRAGLLSMLPNVFPVLVVFGIMGWSNVQVDIGSMMTASVAMGIAVDDTIHFLTWFRRGLDEGRSRPRAILLAYRRVGHGDDANDRDWRVRAFDLCVQHVHADAAFWHADVGSSCHGTCGRLDFLTGIVGQSAG